MYVTFMYLCKPIFFLFHENNALDFYFDISMRPAVLLLPKPNQQMFRMTFISIGLLIHFVCYIIENQLKTFYSLQYRPPYYSTAAERLFNTAGNILRPKKFLKARNFEQLILFKGNTRSFKATQKEDLRGSSMHQYRNATSKAKQL